MLCLGVQFINLSSQLTEMGMSLRKRNDMGKQKHISFAIAFLFYTINRYMIGGYGMIVEVWLWTAKDSKMPL